MPAPLPSVMPAVSAVLVTVTAPGELAEAFACVIVRLPMYALGWVSVMAWLFVVVSATA